MLKTTRSSDLLGPEVGNGNHEVDEFDVGDRLLRNQENRKAKICLSPENRLSQEENCQKVGIHLILALQRPDQAF